MNSRLRQGTIVGALPRLTATSAGAAGKLATARAPVTLLASATTPFGRQ